MVESEGTPNRVDKETVRRSVADLGPNEKKDFILETMRSLEDEYGRGRVYGESATTNRIKVDVAYEALDRLDEPDRNQIMDRFRPSVSDPTARSRQYVVLGFLFIFIIITLALVAAIVFELQGATELGTAFTTLLGALAGFLTGRSEGTGTGTLPPAPTGEAGAVQPRARSRGYNGG